MDEVKLEKLFKKYPQLEGFITAGTISLKAARTILDIDRWLMYDIFVELIAIKAVKGAGPVSWRATDDLREYMRKRGENESCG